MVREFRGLPGFFVGKMAPRNLNEGRKGQPFPESMPFPAAECFVHENGRVLVKVSDLTSDQKNQPSDIKPDEKDDHDSKTRIDGGVLSGVRQKSREPHTSAVTTN